MMKRVFAALPVILLIVLVFPATARADTGPKPSITVRCVNIPSGEVYLDLLIEDSPIDNGFRFGKYEWGEDYPAEYNREMLDALRAYNEDGWRPALTTGTRLPLRGELYLENRDGLYETSFGYMGVPDRFKIIVVSSDGRAVVSNVIERKAFDCVVDFDYATGTATERSAAARTARQFAVTLIGTLIIEGLILLLFRFSLLQNWKPFLFVNLGTQIALNALVTLAHLTLGTALAFVAYIVLEILIFIGEAVLFAVLLKQHSKLRRVAYALTANFVSFCFGLLLLIVGLAVF